MNAGELRHRITFQALSSATDDWGTPTQDWQDVATVWAKVTNKLSASAEAVAASHESSRPVVQFDIRPLAVDPAWRVVHAGVVHDIKSVARSNDNSRTTLIAVAGVEAGQ